MDGQGPVSGAGATFSGQFAAEGSLAGRIAARGPDLSQFMPAPAAPFRVAGGVTAAQGLVAANDLDLELDGSPARASAAFRLAPAERFDLSVAASRLDLEGWLDALPSGTDLGLPVGIDLSAQSAQLAGGTLRRLRAALEFAPSGVALQSLAAVLPGEALLSLSGTAARADGDGWRFNGEGRLDASSLRTTLGWLQGAGLPLLAGLPSGVLRSATLTAKVMARSGEIGLGGVRGRIDGSEVSGAIALRTGAVPVWGRSRAGPARARSMASSEGAYSA